MNINFNEPILNLNNETMEDEGGVITLGRVTSNALLATFPDEKEVSGEVKAKRFKIALKAQEADGDVTVEDVAEIKKLVGKAYGPLVVGRVFDILEGAKVVKLVTASGG
jgi:hypothetical protein